LCGFRNNEKAVYVQRLKDYTDGKNTIADLLERIESDPQNIHLQYQMAKKFTGRWELDKAKPYFEQVLELDPDDQSGYQEDAQGYIAVQTLYETGNYQPLIDLIEKSTDDERVAKGYDVLIRYYKSKKMKDDVLMTYEEVLVRFPENPSFMNGFAWHIYENKISSRYKEGLEIATRAVELKPDGAHIWDTLAWLEFEIGMLDSAIVHMRKAVTLEPDNEYFINNLAQFEGN
jgi:tetratricopeptide (TPR) repeat protein